MRVASRLTRDADLGEDITQEALLAIREAAPRVWARSDWNDADVLRYCKAIAAHKAISAKQRANRQAALRSQSVAKLLAVCSL